MSAYVVFIREETTDSAELAQYAEKAPKAASSHDLTPLAFYGDFEVLEGNPMEGAVILRFPDKAAARAWYDSPAYQDAMRHRQNGSKYRVFIIDSVPE